MYNGMVVLIFLRLFIKISFQDFAVTLLLREIPNTKLLVSLNSATEFASVETFDVSKPGKLYGLGEVLKGKTWSSLVFDGEFLDIFFS